MCRKCLLVGYYAYQDNQQTSEPAAEDTGMTLPVMSRKLHIGDASVQLYFSMDGDKIIKHIQRRHKKIWELNYKEHLGETTGTTLLEGQGKAFVAIWVHPDDPKHKKTNELLLTILHECGHAAREVLRIYNEENTAEETAIRIEDSIRRHILKYVGLTWMP